MKNRLPISNSSTLRPVDLSFLKMAPFWIYSFGNMMQSIAFFLPQIWLPSFARESGMPAVAGPLALCLLNLAACGGYISQGIIVDRCHVTVAICFATLGSMLAVFVFWYVNEARYRFGLRTSLSAAQRAVWILKLDRGSSCHIWDTLLT
jgi:hypothetical protein